MRLLFIDKDNQSARGLHSEFLDYRGVNWSLTHCNDRIAAVRHIEQDNFQCVLYHSHNGLDETGFELGELLQTVNCPPVLTLTENLTGPEQLRLVQDGCDDCFSRSEINGSGIMRRLRMAETRNNVWKRQLSDAVDELWLAATIAGGTIATCPEQLKIAHVAYESSLADPSWLATSSLEFNRIGKLEELIERLEVDVRSFDAILIEQSVFEEASPSAIASMKRFLPVIPGLVLTLEKSDFSSLSYIERGYCDCLAVERTTATSLAMSIRKAVVRRRRSLLNSIAQQQVGPGVNDRRSSVRNAQNRRRHVRFFTQQPVVAIPVLSNGAPDLAGRCNAVTIDVSLGGMGVNIPERDQLPSRNWILGIQQNGGTGWINAYLRRVAYRDNELQVGLIFQSEADDLFGRSNLWPTIDPSTKRFETPIAASALDQWVELGVLKRQLVRRARTCPECDAVCSVGTGCSQCGSFELHFQDLIHHFACAHVNDSIQFEKADSIQCPKCLRDHLVAGADFELIRSQYSCEQCDYQGDVTAEVGCCLNCQLRFPIKLGKEVDIHGYHVERMDILALVDGAR
jgi:Thaumarchaeal output domain 1